MQCNTLQKKGNLFLLKKSMIYTVFSKFQTCHNLHFFPPPLDLVKFYPSIPSPPFETHFNPFSSTVPQYAQQDAAADLDLDPSMISREDQKLIYFFVVAIFTI